MAIRNQPPIARNALNRGLADLGYVAHHSMVKSAMWIGMKANGLRRIAYEPLE